MANSNGPRGRPPRIRWRGRDWTQTAQRQFDPTAGSDLTSVIVLAIADADGVPPHQITEPTLFEYVDVEAVSRLVENASGTDAGTDSVRFGYDGSLIEVRSDGHVSVFVPVGDTK